MEYEVAMGLYQAQVGAMDSLWTIFSGVCFAAIGVLTVEAVRNSRSAIRVVMGAFLFFVLNNLCSIFSAQELLVNLALLVQKSGEGAYKTVTAYSPWRVTFFHSVIDCSVLVILYFAQKQAPYRSMFQHAKEQENKE